MANLTINDIYNEVVQQAYTPPEYTSAVFLRHANIITQKFWNRVVNRRKARSNWDIWTADTVSLQDEYTKPSVSSTTVWAAHIESISVSYGSSTYTQTWTLQYTVCRPATSEEMADWNYYLENQSNLEPIYFERDSSVFIAPDPRSDEVGTNRLQIKGIRSIASGSWTTSTTESETKLPLFALDVITLWCIWKAHAWNRRDRNVINDAKAEFTAEEETALKNMFVEEPFEAQYPDSIWWTPTDYGY